MACGQCGETQQCGGYKIIIINLTDFENVSLTFFIDKTDIILCLIDIHKISL